MVPPYVQYCFISAEVDCRSELDLFYDLIISLLYTVFNMCIRILYYVFNFAHFFSHIQIPWFNIRIITNGLYFHTKKETNKSISDSFISFSEYFRFYYLSASSMMSNKT